MNFKIQRNNTYNIKGVLKMNLNFTYLKEEIEEIQKLNVKYENNTLQARIEIKNPCIDNIKTFILNEFDNYFFISFTDNNNKTYNFYYDSETEVFNLEVNNEIKETGYYIDDIEFILETRIIKYISISCFTY